MNKYSEFYAHPIAAIHYKNKFEQKIDIIRHKIEVSILKKYAHGDLFDCSLGTGRFIPELNNLNDYSGMDYSNDFIEYINKNYPSVKTNKGDLEEKISEPNERYDTVICIRTLFALNNINKIIKEMKRITKKNGYILFDYGTKEQFHKTLGLKLNSYNIKEILDKNNLKISKQRRLDSSVIKLAKEKKMIKKLFNSKYNIIPNIIYLLIERFLNYFSYFRKLYVIKK